MPRIVLLSRSLEISVAISTHEEKFGLGGFSARIPVGILEHESIVQLRPGRRPPRADLVDPLDVIHRSVDELARFRFAQRLKVLPRSHTGLVHRRVWRLRQARCRYARVRPELGLLAPL